MKVTKVIISIPAYNEEKTIGPVIDNIKKVMDNTDYQYKILVVDDGSKDNTKFIAEQKGADVVSHQRNYGLAEAFRTEMKECQKMNFDVIIHTDADGQYHAEDIPRLIKEVENGYDLILGSRFRGKIEGMPLVKMIGNKAFSKVISSITKLKITDGQTGFRAFTRDIVEKVKITSTHTYTQEQIIRSAKEKFSIKEIPVNFAKRGGGTKSRLISNPFEYAAKAWLNIIRIIRDYEPLKIFGTIGMFMILVGVLLGIWLVAKFIEAGRVGHPYVSILMVLFIIVGLQIWLFGLLADMMKK
ncbi:MAG: glycosyltransferase family 2 protein [Candidatus Woesearchaeota archaeon]